MLAPLAIVAAVMGALEVATIFSRTPHLSGASRRSLLRQQRVVAVGTAIVTAAAFVPTIVGPSQASSVRALSGPGGMALGLAVAVGLAMAAEVVAYRAPGQASVRLAASVLAIAYCGGMIGFAAQLRLLSGEPWGEDGRWGMVAVLSMIGAAKACDTGGYFVGKHFGRRPMASLLSPKKTREGALGGLFFAVIVSGVMLGPLAGMLGCQPSYGSPVWTVGVLVYGTAIAASAILGDLAISLLKRDAHLKDSSSWMPGFGGVLDVIDSVLLAAPVAYVLWLLRVVGP